MSATTTQLLSSGEFCKLRYDTIPVKCASAKVPFYTITQKYQILRCDTLVANERHTVSYASYSTRPRLRIINIQDVSGGLVNILGGGSMDISE